VGYIFAQLGIAQHGQGGLGKGRGESWIELGMGAHARSSDGEDSVVARISARWMVFMPTY
jgi:hypothetical protein